MYWALYFLIGLQIPFYVYRLLVPFYVYMLRLLLVRFPALAGFYL